MGWIKLDKVIPLYKQMKSKDEVRVQFDFEYNNVNADAFFFIDCTPFILALGVRRTQYYFEFKIKDGFLIDPWIDGDTFERFKKAFQIGTNTQNKGQFSTIQFFNYVNDTFPQDFKQKCTKPARPQTIAQYHSDIEESDRIYFIGFRDNNKRNSRVRNLDKTLRLMGKEAHDRCKRENLSTCWGDNPNIDNFDNWRSM